MLFFTPGRRHTSKQLDVITIYDNMMEQIFLHPQLAKLKTLTWNFYHSGKERGDLRELGTI